jgi:hypothetical protein
MPFKQWHERLGQRLQQQLRSTPRQGRRRPQPNSDLWVTRFLMRILAQE